MNVRPFWCDEEYEQAVEDALRATCKRHGIANIAHDANHPGNDLDYPTMKALLAKKAPTTNHHHHAPSSCSRHAHM